jgi:hypothetical protein
MLPRGNEILATVPPHLSFSEQIEFAMSAAKNEGFILGNHFEKTIEGLNNIAEFKKKNNSGITIGLNVDIQAMTDLYQIIKLMNEKNIPVTNLILQIQSFSKNNSQLAYLLPNLWRKPTTNMIERYYQQAKLITDTNMFKGNIEIIDQLPIDILEEIDNRGIDLGQFYNPTATPAISPKCELRTNVIL